MENHEQDPLISRLLDLRHRIHDQTAVELIKRKQENPIPSEEEINLGAFKEEIEPQIREAVISLVKKGYEFSSSGFSSERNPQQQHLLGFFLIDETTKQALDSIGVKVEARVNEKQQPMTELSFNTSTASLQEITDKWNKVASILPKISDTMSLSRGNNSRVWRDLYASHRPDFLISDLERQLQDEAPLPEVRNRMQRTIEKLKMQQRLRGELSLDEQKELQRKIAEIEEIEDGESEDLLDGLNTH